MSAQDWLQRNSRNIDQKRIKELREENLRQKTTQQKRAEAKVRNCSQDQHESTLEQCAPDPQEKRIAILRRHSFSAIANSVAAFIESTIVTVDCSLSTELETRADLVQVLHYQQYQKSCALPGS
jgi:hypothetical protein